MTNNESELQRTNAKQLCFTLEVLRKNHGRHVVTQEDLATMTGVPRLRLSRYERMSEVPHVLKDLVAVAYALGIPSIDTLIAPVVREARSIRFNNSTSSSATELNFRSRTGWTCSARLARPRWPPMRKLLASASRLSRP